MRDQSATGPSQAATALRSIDGLQSRQVTDPIDRLRCGDAFSKDGGVAVPGPWFNVRALDVQNEGADINLVSMVLVRAVVAASKEFGVTLNPSDLQLLSCGGLVDPATAISRSSFGRLLRQVTCDANGTASAVQLAAAVASRHLPLVQLFMRRCSSLRQALARLSVVRRVILGGPSWRVARLKCQVLIGHEVDLKREGAANEAEFSAALLHHLVGQFLGPAMDDRVDTHFAFAASEQHRSITSDLRGDVFFRSRLNGVSFPLEALRRLPYPRTQSSAETCRQLSLEDSLLLARPASWTARVQDLFMVADWPVRTVAEDLCQYWRISPRQLGRNLEAEGSALDQVKHRVCMLRAAALLGHEEARVASVAKQLGYTDVVSFRKAFKRYFGEPPGQFSKRHASVGLEFRGVESAPRS